MVFIYEVIEDILPFVLNTKRPLSDIWLLSYEQNNFGCFSIKMKFWISSKTPKTVLPATKYRSEAVLYSKQMLSYPLSPHIKAIAVALLQAG